MINIPYSKKAKFFHKRQQQPNKFKKGTMKTVPLDHTKYKGKKYKNWKKKGSGAKAIVGKKKNAKDPNKWSIQSILIPKKKK